MTETFMFNFQGFGRADDSITVKKLKKLNTQIMKELPSPMSVIRNMLSECIY